MSKIIIFVAYGTKASKMILPAYTREEAIENMKSNLKDAPQWMKDRFKDYRLEVKG